MGRDFGVGISLPNSIPSMLRHLRAFSPPRPASPRDQGEGSKIKECGSGEASGGRKNFRCVF